MSMALSAYQTPQSWTADTGSPVPDRNQANAHGRKGTPKAERYAEMAKLLAAAAADPSSIEERSNTFRYTPAEENLSSAERQLGIKHFSML